MTRLTQKEVAFQWFDECELYFLKLKDLLTFSSILNLPVEVRGLQFTVILLVLV